MRKKKLQLFECEICGERDLAALHKHHIIERTELETTNHELNLAIVCASCHEKIHAGRVKIIGVYPSTKPPNGRTLIFEKNGKSNCPEITEPYYKSTPNAMKIFDKE